MTRREFVELVLPYAKADVLAEFATHEVDGMLTAEEKCFNQLAYMFNGNNKDTVYSCALKIARGGTFFLVWQSDIEDKLLEWNAKVNANYSIDNADELYFHIMAQAVTEICKNFRIKPGDSERFFKASMYNGFIDNHETDLYVKKTPVSEFIIDHLTTKSLVTIFRSNTEPYGTWYELPFCHIK